MIKTTKILNSCDRNPRNVSSVLALQHYLVGPSAAFSGPRFSFSVGSHSKLDPTMSRAELKSFHLLKEVKKDSGQRLH